jgi:thiazole synthase
MPHPNQPFLHDLIIVLAAPTQLLSQRTGAKFLVPVRLSVASGGPRRAVAAVGLDEMLVRLMRLAVDAGRDAYLAGRIPRKAYASASSPLEGVIGTRA